MKNPLEGQIKPSPSSNGLVDAGITPDMLQVKSALLTPDMPEFHAPQLMTEKSLGQKTMYVVMDKNLTTTIHRPGMTQPYNTLVKKHAEQVAKEMGNGHVVVPLRTAIELVANSPCNLPKNHPLYNPDPSADKLKGV